MTIMKEVLPAEAGIRLDSWLVTAYGLSRNEAKKAIEGERVTIDGQLIKKASCRLKAHDVVALKEAPSLTSILEPEPLPLDVLYEDEDILIVNKAAGMLVYPTAQHQSGTLVNALLARAHPLSNWAGAERPGIVHRLDKDTSGLLVVAKNNESHEKLAEGFLHHRNQRQYIALVQGRVSRRCMSIDFPIAKDYKKPLKRVIRWDGRPSLTHIEALSCDDEMSVLFCELETGRTHQIRVHLAAIGHPIIGDWLYGEKKNKFGFQGQALHGWRLILNHPRTYERMIFTAPIPKRFLRVFKYLNWNASAWLKEETHC